MRGDVSRRLQVKHIVLCLLVPFFCSARICESYETETHALMTEQAYVNSVLNVENAGSVAATLGLDRLFPTGPFGAYWLTDTFSDGGELFDGADPKYFNESPGTDGAAGSEFYEDPGPNGQFERCQMQEFLEKGNPNSTLFKLNNTVELLIFTSG
jgi:hypothetical protein